MKIAKLVSITVIVDRQTVEIPHCELKVVDGGFEYDDLFVSVSPQRVVAAEFITSGSTESPDNQIKRFFDTPLG
jgi:hypothetical protein